MLVIKKKNYEVEEKVQLTNDKDEVIYEFDMKITADEMLRIKEILFKDAENFKSKYFKSGLLEREKMEKEVEEKIKAKSDEFEDICFKEHKIPFKEKAGQYKYDETVEEIMGFLMNIFVEKQMKPLNTSLMSLKNYMNKSMKR